jgi:hypothetical protein
MSFLKIIIIINVYNYNTCIYIYIHIFECYLTFLVYLVGKKHAKEKSMVEVTNM